MVLTCKKIDLGLQLILAIPLLFFLYQNRKDLNNIYETPISTLFKWMDIGIFFFALGALQLISAFVHYSVFKQFRKNRLRRIYHIGMISAMAWLSIMLSLEKINVISINLEIKMGVIMIIVSSLLSIFYMLICGKEIRNSRENDLAKP